MVNKQQILTFKGILLDISYTHFITSQNEVFIRVDSIKHAGEDITPLINVLTCIDIEKQIKKDLVNHA